MEKRSSIVTFTAPKDIKLILEAAQKIGYYDSLSEFLRDTVRYMLENKKYLRTAIAYELYAQKKISIGKAAEIMQTTLQETKELFQNR